AGAAPSGGPTQSPGSQGPGSSGSTTPTPAPSSPGPTTSHASPVGAHPCASRNLGVHTGNGEGAAGSTYIPIVFTNNSTATCTLYGYPGVSLAGGTPVHQIGAAADENPSTPRELVTLKPGADASALLRIVAAQNYPAARCHQVRSTYLQVYPPNQTTPIFVMYSSTACSKAVHLLTVDVVKPGTGS
ncbi:MAG: DUF4232 domain-containing protein, partial [Streptosporangiaceae bacterium]